MKAWAAVRPYLERESLAAFFVGISSGFPYAMIGATLTTRLAQDGIDKRTITAFTFAFLVYNLKVFWAWVVDGVRIPVLGRLGQRVSWLLVAGFAVIAAVVNLALVDPAAGIRATVIAAVLVGIAGATYDIVIDAYRIETLKPEQLGVGSGMSQYGWRIGSAAAGALALYVAARMGWTAAYLACAVFALPAMITGLVVGEPARHVVANAKRGFAAVWRSIVGPFAEFMGRHGAWLVLLFVLLHKIGDTLANLTFRLLFNDMGYSNDEIAAYDVVFGFWAYLAGIFVGGILYTKLGLKRSVLLALVVAQRMGWTAAYVACAAFALPAMLTGLILGEPARHVAIGERGIAAVWRSIVGPFAEFLRRSGAWLVLLFVLVHKIGDTLANLTLRLLFNDLGYTNDEIAAYDVVFGFWAYLAGIFVGGILYTKLGLKRSVLLALVLMGVSNFSFALLAGSGHSNPGLAGAIGFENFASGYGGVVVVAYFSALCNLQFTATQYALISAAASVVGRLLTGGTAGALIESLGYVNFYLLTTVLALPGILLFWYMIRAGLVDRALGTAGKVDR